MPGYLLPKTQPTEKLLQRIASRDAALWIAGPLPNAEPATITALARLASLPWRVVIVESTSSEFAQQLEAEANSDAELARRRGFVHLVAFDPLNLQLPPQSLPVFLVNGRDGAPREESSKLSTRSAARRRLNQVARMVATRPEELVFLSFGNAESLSEFQAVWQDELRSLVTVVSSSDADRQQLEEWLHSANHPPGIDFYAQEPRAFAAEVSSLLRRKVAHDRLIVRVRDVEAQLTEVDITSCELPGHPILDRYELILAHELTLLQPTELSFKDLSTFFDRSEHSWRPYAAGLPWLPDKEPLRKTVAALEEVDRSGPESNALLFVGAEPGAGGTVLSRAIAFECARAGFPALVARPFPFRPSATEIESFLLRVRTHAEMQLRTETPWVIVYDVAHWEGRETELMHFMAHLGRRGRPAIIIAVTSSLSDEQNFRTGKAKVLASLQHAMTREDALLLGMHLNRFLTPLGRTKTESEWITLWEENRPGIDTPIASFWISLEFWLRGLLNIGESIQQWLFRQFAALEVSNELRLLILEIAALTVERHPFPEVLMPAVGDMVRPHSVALEDVRVNAPALGLVREKAGATRRWALAHTQLGRYIINSTYFDRAFSEKLGLLGATNPTHLRLLLLRRIVVRAELARDDLRDLAVDFAIRIFKLDPGHTAEFFPLWRDVFVALNDVHSAVRNTSRTFLHHIAISCRRVATSEATFDATLEERESLLRSAVRHLEFALRLPRVQDEESDINLLNSLARAYQNLADARRSAGASDEEIADLRRKATEATFRAQREDPLNPYVLETTAQNLLQAAQGDPKAHVRDTVLAISYISEALIRDRLAARSVQLARLFVRAVSLLRGTDTKSVLQEMQRKGDSMGFVAEAWLLLGESVAEEGLRGTLSPRGAMEALQILDRAPKENEHWLALKLRYDLVSIVRRTGYEEQLRILEELEGTAFPMSLQYQVERAVLLHQVGRHVDAIRRFKALRSELRERDAYVEVPARMRWLLKPGSDERMVCDARVHEATGLKYRARVTNLSGAVVPFTPQEFGQKGMTVGQHLKVTINFGAMGPFAKPPTTR